MPYIVTRPGLYGRVAILKNDREAELVLSVESLEVAREFLRHSFEDDTANQYDPMLPLYVETFKDHYGRARARPSARHRVWNLREEDPDRW